MKWTTVVRGTTEWGSGFRFRIQRSDDTQGWPWKLYLWKKSYADIGYGGAWTYVDGFMDLDDAKQKAKQIAERERWITRADLAELPK